MEKNVFYPLIFIAPINKENKNNNIFFSNENKIDSENEEKNVLEFKQNNLKNLENEKINENDINFHTYLLSKEKDDIYKKICREEIFLIFFKVFFFFINFY